MQKVLRLMKRVRSGLRSFVQEISCWTVLHGRVDHLRLTAIKSRHRQRTISVLPRKRCRYTQYVRINRVISENEKCVFYFMEKNKRAFWSTQQIGKEIYFWECRGAFVPGWPACVPTQYCHDYGSCTASR